MWGPDYEPWQMCLSYPNFWPKILHSYVIWPWIVFDFSEKNSVERCFKIPHFWFRVRPSYLFFSFSIIHSLLILIFNSYFCFFNFYFSHFYFFFILFSFSFNCFLFIYLFIFIDVRKCLKEFNESKKYMSRSEKIFLFSVPQL